MSDPEALFYMRRGLVAMAECLVRLQAAGEFTREHRQEQLMLGDAARALDLAGHSLDAPNAALRALQAESKRREDAAWAAFLAAWNASQQVAA